MSRVRSEDVQALLRITREVGELPAGTGEREQHLLTSLGALLGAPFGFLFHAEDFAVGKLPIRITGAHQVGTDSTQVRLVDRYMEDVSATDPLPPVMASRLAELRPGELFSARRQDMLTAESWYGSSHVSEFRKAVDMDACQCSVLKKDHEGRVAILAFHRPWRDPQLGERERQLADLIWREAALLVEPLTDLGGRWRAEDGHFRPGAALSARPREVLQHLLYGRAPSEIAFVLGISEHTVRTYVKRLLRAFGVSSQVELRSLCAGFPVVPPNQDLPGSEPAE